MTEKWAVSLIDHRGDKHLVSVNADSQPSAIEEARTSVSCQPVVIKRVRRVFDDLCHLEWGL